MTDPHGERVVLGEADCFSNAIKFAEQGGLAVFGVKYPGESVEEWLEPYMVGEDTAVRTEAEKTENTTVHFVLPQEATRLSVVAEHVASYLLHRSKASAVETLASGLIAFVPEFTKNCEYTATVLSVATMPGVREVTIGRYNKHAELADEVEDANEGQSLELSVALAALKEVIRRAHHELHNQKFANLHEIQNRLRIEKSQSDGTDTEVPKRHFWSKSHGKHRK